MHSSGYDIFFIKNTLLYRIYMQKYSKYTKSISKHGLDNDINGYYNANVVSDVIISSTSREY